MCPPDKSRSFASKLLSKHVAQMYSPISHQVYWLPMHARMRICTTYTDLSFGTSWRNTKMRHDETDWPCTPLRPCRPCGSGSMGHGMATTFNQYTLLGWADLWPTVSWNPIEMHPSNGHGEAVFGMNGPGNIQEVNDHAVARLPPFR